MSNVLYPLDGNKLLNKSDEPDQKRGTIPCSTYIVERP